MGKRYFSTITWLNLRRSALKVTKWMDKLGTRMLKMCIILPPGDRSRDTAHAQWPFQPMVMWSDWVTHNSAMDNRRMFKICLFLGCKLNSSNAADVKRSKVKVTRSNKICAQKQRTFTTLDGYATAHPPVALTDFSKRSFRCAAPSVWNSLPASVIISHSLSVFKSKMYNCFACRRIFRHRVAILWLESYSA